MAEMVMVGCKAPNGLILNLDKYEKYGDQNQVRRVFGSATVMLAGWSRAWGMPDTTEGGYALTPVPADFWAAWFETHKDSSLLADKIILPPHARDTAGKARDHAEVKQMFAPAKPSDVPKIAPDKAA